MKCLKCWPIVFIGAGLLLAGCPRRVPSPQVSFAVTLPPSSWTPAEWQQDGKLRDWVRDRNGDFVDDAITAGRPDKEVTAIVDFNGCINDAQDVSFLNQYGHVVYIGRYVSYAIVAGLKAGLAPRLASEPGVAMVELAAGGRWLDTERQAMKVEASNAGKLGVGP